MNTPGYEPGTWNDDALLAAVEKANGGPIRKVEYLRRLPDTNQPVDATCTRCGETSASFCEDWDCHKGWSKP